MFIYPPSDEVQIPNMNRHKISNSDVKPRPRRGPRVTFPAAAAVSWAANFGRRVMSEEEEHVFHPKIFPGNLHE